MRENFLLENNEAVKLYKEIAAMPIIDYHCHLSPKEIYEDLPFDNIGEIWLSADHYKWRMMRQAGMNEDVITGNADWHEKFISYITALELAANNPLYTWSKMELSMYFGVDLPITAENAEAIWDAANAKIKETGMSPRKLIAQSKVEVICTTDDLADELVWHEKIKADESFDVQVLPSFRYDNLLLMRREGYADYIRKLSAVSQTEITDLPSLKEAVSKRFAYFMEHGCKVTDIGIPFFPDAIACDEKADAIFRDVLSGKDITDSDYLALIGNLYLFMGKLFVSENLLSQWHLAVTRNSNSALFARCGADCGVDCVGEPVSGKALIYMLDSLQKENALPQTIIYSLNEQNLSQIASVAGAFPGVRCGAAWWFNDHKRGIIEQMEIIAENGVLGKFYGMLTDSRSFLSYARHDYFRRILCTMVGKWVELDEYDEDAAVKLVMNIAYTNIKNYLG